MPKKNVFKEYRYDGSLAYEGEIRNGQYFGYGRFYYPDGVLMYDGEFNGLQDGYGILYYENGRVMYRGEFKAGKAHGEGELFNENSQIIFSGNFYAGQAVNDITINNNFAIH